MRTARLALLPVLLLIPVFAIAERPSFSKDVKPILEARCLKCHSGAMQMGKLDLRSHEAARKGGERGPAILPGDPDRSSLYRRVAGLEKPAMPMDGKLSAAEIAILREWIRDGAHWNEAIAAEAKTDDLAALEDMELPPGARDWWSFRRPAKAAPPKTGEAEWDAHPVDAFLRHVQKQRGLTAAPLADKRTLARRAYLDLAGLPPTPDQVHEFLNDDSPDAWPKLIERLLASPSYGERWGRHWLDVARYADSNGYEHDFDRPNAWRYRDYVIQSFNRDTPFDVFLAEQLAGDEMEEANYDRLAATGFLRNYAKVGFREKDNPQFRFDYLDDMIATVGRGVLGLTLQCARCHNHKFDPVSQKDYYRLQASLFGYVEVDHPLVPPEEAKAYEAKMAEIAARIKPLAEEIRRIEEPHRQPLLEAKYRKWPAHIQKAVFTPEEERTPGQVLLANQIIRTTSVSSAEIDRAMPAEDVVRKRELEARIKEIEKEKPPPIPVAMGITDGDYRFTPDGPGDEPAPGKGVKREAIEGSYLCDGSKPYQAPPSHFLHNGDMHSRGSLMKPGFPAVLTNGDVPVELRPAHQRTSGRRLALAKWLGSPENPLTARVIVNRVWHHHFGRGIVTTLDNFGKTGEPPTHPELLDWLAVDFVEKGWSIKQLHRLLMTSRAYRLSSQFAEPANLKNDADNLYWWRFRAQRLEAEALRDSILAIAGTLKGKRGGPAIFPELPQDVLASMKHGIWKQGEDGPDVWRRSVYIYRKRGLPFPFFETFDLPDQNVSCGRRNVSTVPTQALTLVNNEWVLKQAGFLAERIAREAPDGLSAQVGRGYELALGRPPDADERRLALEFLREHALADFAHVLLNLNEFVYLR